MNWLEESKALFAIPRPEHFTDYRHCEECFEHDQTLLNATLDGIGREELGNPGWDPLCFVGPEGLIYYFPALVRLCLESDEEWSYIGQFLFHLIYDGPQNRHVRAFSEAQRDFVVRFLNHLLETRTELISLYGEDDQLLTALRIWSGQA
jgi:hypothetical protein